MPAFATVTAILKNIRVTKCLNEQPPLSNLKRNEHINENYEFSFLRNNP